MQLVAPSRPAHAGGLLAVCVLVCLALAPAAGALTIHACVKSKSGATRIVSAKAKCRHGEQRLSWNTVGPKGATGPAGAPGAVGAEGKAGPSGEGPVYSAAGSTSAQAVDTGTIVVSKVLPPGSYDAGASIDIGSEATEEGFFSAICGLIDAPGTTPILEGAGVTNVDIAFDEQALGKFKASEWASVGTMTLQGAFSSKDTTTLSVGCSDLNPTGPALDVLSPQLQALAVTAVL